MEEIEDYMTSLLFEPNDNVKRDVFATINVDYDKLNRYYPDVTRLEQTYRKSPPPRPLHCK